MAIIPYEIILKYPDLIEEDFYWRKRFLKKKYLRQRFYGYADRKKQPEKEILADRREKFHQLYVAIYDLL